MRNLVGYEALKVVQNKTGYYGYTAQQAIHEYASWPEFIRPTKIELITALR